MLLPYVYFYVNSISNPKSVGHWAYSFELVPKQRAHECPLYAATALCEAELIKLPGKMSNSNQVRSGFSPHCLLPAAELNGHITSASNESMMGVVSL